MKEYKDHLIRNWNFIDLKIRTAANLTISELQRTRTASNSTKEFIEDEVAGNVSFGIACRCMEYPMHERHHEKVQTLKYQKHDDPKLSVNSVQATFTGIDPNHFDFDHIICNRGYYDKDEFTNSNSRQKYPR